ncbi:MAG: TRAP transporter large permease [Desulfarculaceae bacterium]|jgi:tripartite ATP-independent transporter DctM subunit
MSETATGLVGIAVLLILFCLRMPVAFAMAFVGIAGCAYILGPEVGLSILGQQFFQEFSAYTLTCIPMFMLMGALASQSGISKRLYSTAYQVVGATNGGLTMATVLACASFAAMSGSTTATAAAMGAVALPEMKRYKYKDSLATGCVAAAGTLGILIPPSTIFIIYGLITQQSIGKLFVAGIVPGILITGMFIITVALVCWKNPEIAPPGERTNLAVKLRSLAGFTDAFLLFLLVIGGLLLGWFGPTAAGGIGALGTLFLGLARRSLNWSRFMEALKNALLTATMILFIIAGATVFGKFMTLSGIPTMLAELLNSLKVSGWAIILLICLGYLIGGCFMDSLPLIVLTVPIVYPTVLAYNFDPIWFGVIIVLVTEMGVITPPVGVNVYVIKGIAPDVPIEKIFQGIMPFLLTLLVSLGLLILFPGLSTFLPSLITY